MTEKVHSTHVKLCNTLLIPIYFCLLGQQLYHNAVQQLELIDKRLNADTTKSIKEPTSVTDRLLAKIATLWSSSSIPTSDVSEKIGISKVNEYSAATELLEESARDYKNNDALLLLAELNFVSIQM